MSLETYARPPRLKRALNVQACSPRLSEFHLVSHVFSDVTIYCYMASDRCKNPAQASTKRCCESSVKFETAERIDDMVLQTGNGADHRTTGRKEDFWLIREF